MKTCFVIIGYGIKSDLSTGRKLNLDKTYLNLIQPVLKSLNIDCFRAIDKNKTGVIDQLMYEWILKADIVIADISTLNANVIYELGVRHALKPYSTIIISEKKLMEDLPFDIDHTIIHQYEHLETDIGHTEVLRFRKHLKKLLNELILNPKTDSPVYTYLHNLDSPKLKKNTTEKISKKFASPPSLSELIIPAETALNRENFSEAKLFFKAALDIDRNNTYLIQRYALTTYYEKPQSRAALLQAEKILLKLKPNETNDPETLGLSGAINKRLYELTKKNQYLENSIKFYERGFYIQQDYYNGINFAYVLSIRASIEKKKYEAISLYLQANRVRKQVIAICQSHLQNKNFNQRDDKEWIFQSIAQAYLGLGNMNEVKKLMPQINKYSKGLFDLGTFLNQNMKLSDLINKFKSKYPDIN